MRFFVVPPLNLLWSDRPGDGSHAAVLHRCYRREIWRERGFWGRLGIYAGYLLWLPAMALLIGWYTARNGAAIRRRSGRGVLAQIGDQFRLAAAHGIYPPWYYVFELYDDAKRRNAGDYLLKHEMYRGIYAFVKEHLEPHSGRTFLSKARFAARCRAEGLPYVPVLLTVDAEGCHWQDADAGSSGLPEMDLFAKPLDDKSGAGAERWLYRGDGRYEGNDGTVLDSAALVAHLQQQAQRRTRSKRYVVQPRVLNHPEIRDLSGDVLSTVRLLTCRDEVGGFECTHAVFKMAVAPRSVVDNFHAGGIAAKVDLASGELGRAIDLGFTPGHGWCESHPVTGVRILGRKIPMWDQIVALGLRAHAAIPERTLVGWDVALLPDGPVLLEAQASSDLDFVQRTHEHGLGDSRCGELLAHHVQRAIRERDSLAPESANAGAGDLDGATDEGE